MFVSMYSNGLFRRVCIDQPTSFARVAKGLSLFWVLSKNRLLLSPEVFFTNIVVFVRIWLTKKNSNVTNLLPPMYEG